MMAERKTDATAADQRDTSTACRCQEPRRLVGSGELQGHKAKGCA
jgi:hypothetical protein